MEPLNLGATHCHINDLVDIVAAIAGVKLKRATTSKPPRASAAATATTR